MKHKHKWGREHRNLMGYPTRTCSCGATQIKTDGRWKYGTPVNRLRGSQ